MGMGGDAPDDRTMLGEGRNTMEAYQQLAPEIYNMYSQYAPLYAQAGAGSYNSALSALYPAMSGYVNDANTAYRQGLVGDISSYGNDAYNAIKGVNGSQSRIMAELGNQAYEELKNAGNLSARDTYDMAQLARAAGDARGNLMGNSTVFNELLNNENLKRERQDSARTFASNVAGMENTYYTSPALALMTATSSVPSLASSAAMQSGFGISPSTFNPWESAYAADLYNTNYNAKYNSYQQGQNNLFGALGGLMNAGGQVGAAAAGGGGSSK